jgi:hypothetical protein
MRPRFDDLIPEESETVQKAIHRLPPKEAYDRVFRIRRAFQVRVRPLPSDNDMSNAVSVYSAPCRTPSSPLLSRPSPRM